MHRMTETNLKDAFAGESQAHMKYLLFADVAEGEGRPNLARLFRAIAHAERVHAANHLRELGGIGDSVANLGVAIGGETFEVDDMYPAYHAVAKLQGETGAVRSTHYALEAERIHAGMYERARGVLQGGSDLTLGDVHICSVCGYTVEGEAPENCPVCGASRAKFIAY